MLDYKTCGKCRKCKHESQFSLNRHRFDGLDQWCKQCRFDYRQTDRAKELKRSSNLRFRYGIDEEVYDQLFEKQNGDCGICHESTNLVVDHDHNTGEVRGLLCSNCNSTLGKWEKYNNMPEIAISYLSNQGD